MKSRGGRKKGLIKGRISGISKDLEERCFPPPLYSLLIWNLCVRARDILGEGRGRRGGGERRFHPVNKGFNNLGTEREREREMGGERRKKSFRPLPPPKKNSLEESTHKLYARAKEKVGGF